MKSRTRRWPILFLACLLLAACKDKHDPLKPTVAQPAITAPATAAPASAF
ncbi:MAG: hypothetical protein H7335_22845 [Massilia sp.]|nr:hypothetical protein [Massilia sp.]